MKNKHLVFLDMGDESENINESEDDCGDFITPELDNVFKQPFHLEREQAITLSKNYILHMSATTLGSETSLGLGLSSYESAVYSVGASTINCTHSLPAETSPIVNVRFAPDNPSLMYVGCTKGLIRLWDLRTTKQPAQEFKDTSDPKAKKFHEKTFSSFDVNSSGRFLCAGTEVVDGDAFLLFWDTRQASLLGGYWECHTDDITQVSFHPKEPDQVVTGSTDGLINLFDVSQTEEQDALLQSFNTDSSVEKLRWHEGSAVTVSCVTHTEDVQLWHLEDSAPYTSLTRAHMETALQMDGEELTGSLYVADVHSTCQPDHLLVLAGSNQGTGRCLRSGIANSGKLSPQSYFDGNKQIIRCSWYHAQEDYLVTGGEAGILSLWRSGSGEVVPTLTKLKATSKLREKPHKKKSKPY